MRRVACLLLCLPLFACPSREPSTRARAQPSAPPPPPPSPSASASASADAEKDAGAPPSNAARALACLANHYEARVDGDALVADGVRIPYDDGKTKSAFERFESPDVEDVFAVRYEAGAIRPVESDGERDGPDPGRVRLEPLFRATYGRTPVDVSASLVTVKLRGLSLSVHERIRAPIERVASRLDAAVAKEPSLDRFFTRSGGTFASRTIAGTDRASAHTWAIAIDLDPAFADYWRNAPDPKHPVWRNRMPQAIVDAFEAEGFVWGGRWFHYDTMHFEYRPEMFDGACGPIAPPSREHR